MLWRKKACAHGGEVLTVFNYEWYRYYIYDWGRLDELLTINSTCMAPLKMPILVYFSTRKWGDAAISARATSLSYRSFSCPL